MNKNSRLIKKEQLAKMEKYKTETRIVLVGKIHKGVMVIKSLKG